MELDEDRPFSFDLLTDVHWAKNGLDAYVTLSHEVENMLDVKEREIDEKFVAAMKHVDKEEEEFVAGSFALELRNYESTFRYLQREAMFLTLYNYFENLLNKLAKAVGEEIKSRVKLTDIHGKGVERALLYLNRVSQFEFKSAQAEKVLTEIRGANQLRNVIVHAGAVLPAAAKEHVNQFVTAHPHMEGKPGNDVLLQRDFVPAFAEILGQFFDRLHDEMQDYMDRTWRLADTSDKSPK
jgi:hypothetical protein